MAILERTHEIGLMQALGTKPFLISAEVIFEAVCLLIVGVIIGNIAGWQTCIYFRGGIDLSVFSSATQFMGLSKIIYPHIYLRDWVVINLMIFILGILGSIYPAWKAAKTDPLKALTGK